MTMSRYHSCEMANNSVSRNLPFNSLRTIGLILWFLCLAKSVDILQATPVFAAEDNYGDLVAESSSSTSESTKNTSSTDLYVIRAVVYEIGVLTDADNTTDNSTERHEKVDLSFYDPPHKENGLLDLDQASPSEIVSNVSRDDNDVSANESTMNV